MKNYYRKELEAIANAELPPGALKLKVIGPNGSETNWLDMNAESLAALNAWAEKVIPGAKKRAAAKKAGAAVRDLQRAEAQRQIAELRAALADITARAAVEMDQSCTARGLVNCDILARSRAALENNKGII